MKKAKRQFKVEAIISQAIADGKLSEVVEPVWRAIGMRSIAALKDLVARTPGNPALTSTHDVAASTPAALDAILFKARGQIENLFSPLFDRTMALAATIDAFREVALSESARDQLPWATMMDALDCITPENDFLDAMVVQLTGLVDTSLRQAHLVQQSPAAAAAVPTAPPSTMPRKRDQLATQAFFAEGVEA